MRAFEQLEALCARLGLELQGTQSPAYRVTAATRRFANVPPDASFKGYRIEMSEAGADWYGAGSNEKINGCDQVTESAHRYY